MGGLDNNLFPTKSAFVLPVCRARRARRARLRAYLQCLNVIVCKCVVVWAEWISLFTITITA